MAKRFGFVTGDIGGTRMMVPSRNYLTSLGHEVKFAVDGNGKGIDVLKESRINSQVFFDFSQKDFIQFIKDVDLMFISTCATASGLEIEFANNLLRYPYNIPVVMGADGFFNHGYKKWQSVQAKYWFAITEGHAAQIRGFRPNLPPKNVPIVGQPAFDHAMKMIPQKEEIRLSRRRELGIGENEKAVLWWPEGQGKLIEENIGMVKLAINALRGMNIVFMMNGAHPKLENVKKGYVAEIVQRISDYCNDCGIKYLDTRSLDVSFGDLYQLCLASDVILSSTSTEDIINTMMGGPPVVHLLGPITRNWMEEELSLKPPFYLPDVFTGESLLATEPDEILGRLVSAFSPDIRQRLRAHWQPPQGSATEKVAKTLIALAN